MAPVARSLRPGHHAFYAYGRNPHHPRKGNNVNYSQYQTDIFEAVKHLLPGSHIVVEAKAGSGKLFTCVEAMKHVPDKDIRCVAFNKHIATEMQSKVPGNVEAVTMHSFCLNQVLKRAWRHRLQIKSDKVQRALQWDIMRFKSLNRDEKKDYYAARSSVCQMIGLLKAQAYVNDDIDPTIIDDLSNRHDIEIPTLRHHEWMDLLGQTWRHTNQMTRIIDFDDMIYFPIYHNLEVPKCDIVFVDEAQDLNPVQIDIAKQMAHSVVAVGDTYQAIYGFRGADPDAMLNLTTALEPNVTTLPLDICYRCPVAVIEEAQKIVPDIQHAPDAEQGVVDRIPKEKFPEQVSEGDYVLCRTTAPLVSGCLGLISEGVKATVVGREIGQGLTKLVEKMEAQMHTVDIPAFMLVLSDHESSELARLQKRERDSEIMALQDKCAAIRCIADKCENVGQIKGWIDDIFSNDATDGVTFATVHRSKGLEAPVVYILRPDLMPHPMAKKEWQAKQEANLKYVAITRAEDRLIYVDGE